MLGVGPGEISSDAYMMGIDPMTQRRRMNESLDVIMALLRGEGPITRETDWFSLHEARLQLAPYSQPHLHVAVASTYSPSGMMAAGAHGLGVLSLGGSIGKMIVTLEDQWGIGSAEAAKHGRTMNRADWRIVLPFHIAEDRDEAINDVKVGAAAFQHEYVGAVLGRIPEPGEDDIGATAARGEAIVGDPDDAVRILKDLQEKTGGFGGFLGLFHDWAPLHKQLRSYELFARYVIPHFQGQMEPLRSSEQWVSANKRTIFGATPDAIKQAFHEAGREMPGPISE